MPDMKLQDMSNIEAGYRGAMSNLLILFCRDIPMLTLD